MENYIEGVHDPFSYDDYTMLNANSSHCAETYITSANAPAYINLYTMQTVVMLAMVLFQAVLRIIATEGNEEAADLLILGVYRGIFWFIVLITLVAAFPVTYYKIQGDDMPAILTALIWAFHRFSYEGISFLLLKQGVGKQALGAAFYQSFLWGCCTFLCVFLVVNEGYDMDAVLQVNRNYNSDTDIGFHMSVAISAGYSSLLIVFYGLLFFLPGLFHAQRPALRLYSAYWLLYEGITVFDVVVTSYNIDWPFCLECANKWGLFGVLGPFVVLRTLRSDCLYWQGMYSPEDDSLNAPLMGGHGILRRDSVEQIAGTLTDMKQVKQIPYGMVKFEDRRSYAAGASARVYKGHLYNASKKTKQTVAIKMLFCMELNSDVIERFGQEVQLLNSLSDPNVVRCEGICIMPPALCMLTEFCSHGSLYEFLYKRQTREQYYERLGWNRKLSMMVDAARGVSYLHKMGILHGDIKSLNFLVTDALVVKLSDLGEHRVFRENQGRGTEGEDGRGEENYRPLPKNRNWSPPEVLSGTYIEHDYTLDVYSLGMVLSEMLLGEIPFDTRELARCSMEDFALFVYDGRNRPVLEGKEIREEVVEIVKRCWMTEPMYRCEAKEVLDVLLDCYDTHRVVRYASVDEIMGEDKSADEMRGLLDEEQGSAVV